MKYLAWHHAASIVDSPAELEKAMAMAEDIGMTDLIPHVQDFAFPLKNYSHAARAKGVKVHAWVSPAFCVEDKIRRTLPEASVRAMQDEFNFVLLGACMNHPHNRENGLKNIAKFLQENEGFLDGLHLDYIRSDNAQLLRRYPCECEACRAYRKRYLGYERLTEADLDNMDVMYKEIEFRSRNITEFVRRAKQLASEAGLELSIAARANYINQKDLEAPPVYGLGPAVFEGQDWLEWADKGLVDFICPMNYHTDTSLFESVFHDHQRLMKGAKARHYPGIGVQSSLGPNPPERVKKHVEIVKQAGAEGCTFFAFGYITAEHGQALKEARA